MRRSIVLSIFVICLIAAVVCQSSGKTHRKRTAEKIRRESKRKLEDAYRRYVSRKPSPHKDDLYMEEIFEVFNTKSRPPAYFASDDDIDLFIRCDFQNHLEECNRLKESPIPEEALYAKPPPPPGEDPQMPRAKPEINFDEDEDEEYGEMAYPPRHQTGEDEEIDRTTSPLHTQRPRLQPLDPYLPFDQVEEYAEMGYPPRPQYPRRPPMNPYFGQDQEQGLDSMPFPSRRQFPRRPNFPYAQDEEYDVIRPSSPRQYPGMRTNIPNFGYDAPFMRGQSGGVMPSESNEEGDYNYYENDDEYDIGMDDQSHSVFW